MHDTPVVLKGPRPWAFTIAELTAGIRRRFCDSSLVITELKEISLKNSRPASGKIRGIQVTYSGSSGMNILSMVVKQPHNSTRSGSAGAGRQEAAFYTYLAENVPFVTPELWAANKAGKWLVLEHLPSLRDPDDWLKDDYLLAVDMLVHLHDRFWGLKEDMSAYSWLSRPLTSDRQIHIKSAEKSLKRISEGKAPSQLTREKGLAADLERLVIEAEKIAAGLIKDTATLIHGDYWPGNLSLIDEGRLAAFDWQQVGIGPGILDLVSFVQNSRWWFDPLPWTNDEIQERYRTLIEKCSGCTWKDHEWQEQWDYGLMWRFLIDWMPLLTEIPEPVLDTRLHLLQETWLDPVRKAISNRL